MKTILDVLERAGLGLCRAEPTDRSRGSSEAGPPAPQPIPAVVAVPVHIDLLRLTFSELTRAGLLRLMLQSTASAVEQLGSRYRGPRLPPDLRERRALGLLSGDDLERRSTQFIEGVVDWARSASWSPKVLLLIDEYERILGATGFPELDGIEFFDYLRGLLQAYPGTFNFLIAGLDGTRASVSRIQGRQNPLFGLVGSTPLAGLERVEMGELPAADRIADARQQLLQRCKVRCRRLQPRRHRCRTRQQAPAAPPSSLQSTSQTVAAGFAG